jgi:hypothetical protein
VIIDLVSEDEDGDEDEDGADMLPVIAGIRAELASAAGRSGSGTTGQDGAAAQVRRRLR